MYIWKINELVKLLREGSLTEQQRKKYVRFFVIILAFTIISFSFIIDPSSFNTYDLIDLLGFILINGIGIYAVYRINKKGHNRDWAIRYFSLTIPIFLRVILWSTLLLLGSYMIVPFFLDLSLEETNGLDLSVSLLTEVVFNLMMVHYFRKVNSY